MDTLQPQLKSAASIDKNFLDRLYQNLYMRRAFLDEATRVLEAELKETKKGENDKTLHDIRRDYEQTIRALLQERVTKASADLA